jgi:quercetin dioxygenase-like cupin family protein
MASYELSVREDWLAAGGPALTLDRVNRVVYVVRGDLDVTIADQTVTRRENEAWQGADDCWLSARSDARLWRWELRALGGATPRDATGTSVKLARVVDLAAADYLMRCDRVDFPLGGIAYTHTHQGPGIRMLLRGRFRVETGGHTLEIAPGHAWFESGPDHVYAEASREEPTSFVRVMILPRALLGKSSISYVKPEDRDRPKSQTYTVFVDAPIGPA